jgi:hypothetical protein
VLAVAMEVDHASGGGRMDGACMGVHGCMGVWVCMGVYGCMSGGGRMDGAYGGAWVYGCMGA